jgi:regulatory protein
MAFARPKKREPVGEAGLFEYAVGLLARRMRTERDLRRLMRARAEEGEAGARAMDAVVVRLKELNYLSDTRFAEDYTRVRKEHEKVWQEARAAGSDDEGRGEGAGRVDA